MKKRDLSDQISDQELLG